MANTEPRPPVDPRDALRAGLERAIGDAPEYVEGEGRERRRRRAAKHEAAHAVVAAQRGMAVGDICICEPGREFTEWGGHTSWAPIAPRDGVAELAAALAGEAAERPDPEPPHEETTDGWTARELLSKHGLTDVDLKDGWDVAQADVAEKSAAIDLVTERLLESALIPGHELRGMLNELLGVGVPAPPEDARPCCDRR